MPPVGGHRRIAAEQLVAPVAGEGDRDLAPREARQEIERHEAHVGDRLVEQHAEALEHRRHVRRRDQQFLVHGAQALGRQTGEAALVVRALGVADRERAQAWLLPHGTGRDRGGVDAAAEEAAERHVADEPQRHRVVEPPHDLAAPRRLVAVLGP